MTTTYDKDGAYIEEITDSVAFRRSIKWEDCVVSVPANGSEKVDMVYVNSSDQLVLVLEDESEITVASSGDLTTHAALTTGVHGVGAGVIVGTTLAQTLTNKTLTAPTLNGTVTLGSTPIFDAGSGSAQINTTGANRGLDIYSTQDVGTGVRIRARQISASPAIDDVVLFIEGDGKDSGGADQSYCLFDFMIEDPTAGSEAGKFRWRTIVAAAWNTAMTLSSAGRGWFDDGVDCDNAGLLKALYVELAETTTPSAVATFGKLYTKNTNKFFFQDGAGSEHEMAKVSELHTQNTDTDLDATFEATFEKVANKGAASGYAALDASSVVAQTPKVHAARHTTSGDLLYVPRTYVWFIAGTVATGTEQGPTFRIKRGTTVEDIELHIKTAPTGAALIVDINENGTTLFDDGDSGVKPEIDISGTVEDDNHVFTDTALAATAELTMDIDQVGSTEAGVDLTVLLHCKEPVI